MFIAQPSNNLGDLICKELASKEAGQRRWHTFEFAVAWINYSGASRIKASAQEFLGRRGCIRATVGLDFGSTTYEGLGCLLDLENGNVDITTHVFCDENPACTFHPKVFLFAGAKRARLIVGSNNMTGAGLRTNVEAALGFAATAKNDTIVAARNQLESWRNERDSRSRRLTRELLEQLRDRRYVLTEDEIRDRRRSEAISRSSLGPPLFGRGSTLRPRRGGGASGRTSRDGHTAWSALGEVLLMRVRPRRNGKQLQISMKVLDAAFMRGAKEVVSVDGTRRAIGYNQARGVHNTARFEAPEMMGMRTPVARFQWVYVGRSGRQTDKVLRYEIFDADGAAEGARILRSLEEGISRPPVTDLEELSHEETVLSTSRRASAQWYRLASA